ncbi:MAG: disulfide bond formation protein B [Gammaproteobacteria bacterium]
MTMLRRSYLAAAAIAALALAIAYFFMERYLLLDPCPLCILDRIVVFVMLVLFAASFVFAHARRILWFGNIAALACGFVVAGRHLWLQYQPPDDGGACLSGAGGGALLDIIRESFSADGDCSAVYWQFAGLSIPEMVFLLFCVFALLLLWQGAQLFGRRRKEGAR